MKNLFFATTAFLLMLIGTNSGYAQPERFGKNVEADLEKTVYELAPDAPAVVLFDVGHAEYKYDETEGFQIFFTRHRRVKILDKNAFDMADVKIWYRNGGQFRNQVSSVRAATYNLVDGKVEDEKVRNRDMFTEQVNDEWAVRKFAFPNVKEGSIIEYSYTETITQFTEVPSWYFQEEVPVLWSEYSAAIPEYYKFKRSTQGAVPLQYEEKELYDKIDRYNVEFTTHKYHWIAKNVPAFKEEPFMPAPDEFISQVYFELSTIDFPWETVKNYTQTWSAINKTLLDITSFGGFINQQRAVRDEVAQITGDAEAEMEKLLVTYTYLQNTVNWNGIRDIYATERPKKILENKSGSAADINLLLVLMLREAGIQSNPVILSTTDHGIVNPGNPNISEFNYTIASAVVDDRYILLDATDKYLPAGMLPARCLNGNGRLINETGGMNMSLLNNEKSVKMIMADLTMDTDGNMSGTVSTKYSSLAAASFRKDVNENGFDKYIEDFENSHHNWEVQNFEVENLENIYDDVTQKLTVNISNESETTSDLIFFTPMLMEQIEENPFKAQERSYPIDFVFPREEMVMLKLTLPEGYVVDEVPENMQIALPDNDCVYGFTVSAFGNVVQMTSKMQINRTFHSPENYATLRNFFEQVVSKQAGQIVLKKEAK